VSYSASVKNQGPAVATATTLSVTFAGLLPADLATIQAPKGCLVAGAVVNCPLGNLKRLQKSLKTVSVKPSTPGTITVSLIATSSTPSANPGSSSAQLTTIVH
jgi:hypothetical protein